MPTVSADYTEVKISLGDGGAPESFTEWAMINMSKSVGKTANLTEQEIPDATTPGNPMSIVRQLRSKDYTVAGEGILHVTDLIAALANVGVAQNFEIEIGTASNGGVKIAGAFILQTFEAGVQNKETATANIQLVPQNSGAITETALL